VTPGDSQPYRCSHISISSSVPNNAKPTSIHCAGKIARSSVPVARATRSALGAHTITGQDANAIGVTAVGVSATTSSTRCWPRASGRWDTGFSPPSCCTCPVHRGVLPENWVSISRRAIAGAGGCAMLRCPMRWITNWLSDNNREIMLTCYIISPELPESDEV
jgi:hypothetical protein